MKRLPVDNGISVVCKCGNAFIVFPYRANEAKYCSMDCQRKYRTYNKTGRLIMNCEVCSKEFVTWDCKRKHGNGRCCSRDCFNQLEKASRPVEFSINENGCFIVTSHATYSTGYVVLSKHTERKALHRLVYEECFGEIPKGLVVRHKCDVRNCINPEHLEIGTQADNVRDTVERNRTLRGVDNPQSKLDEEMVRKIKSMLSRGSRICEITKLLNINKSTVSNIKRGAWKHII